MANPINLLPTEFAPTGSAVKLARVLRGALLVGFTIFILVAVGATSFFIINFFNIRSSKGRQETLKSAIKSLEVTEQRLVLVQDRIKIAKTLLAKSTAADDLATLQGLLGSMGQGTSLTEADISSDKTKFSILSSNSSDLAKFMATLISGNLYTKIDLSTFSFSPQGGYLASFGTQVK